MCGIRYYRNLLFQHLWQMKQKTGEANMQVCEHSLLQMQHWVCPKNNVKERKIEKGGPH